MKTIFSEGIFFEDDACFFGLEIALVHKAVNEIVHLA